ncbi:MAG TPA: LysM peptidoglycan-binding domain-containing protein [Chloroflexota bacterium]
MASGESPPEPAPSPQRSRFWFWAAGIVLIVAIVGATIGLVLGSRQGGPLASQVGGNGRPAIVVPTPPAAPSVSPGPSPSVVPSNVVVGATPAAPAAATQYVVQPGDTLRSIALEQYGDAEQWQRIYQANRAAIGPNPDALVTGMTLELPPPQ